MRNRRRFCEDCGRGGDSAQINHIEVIQLVDTSQRVQCASHIIGVIDNLGVLGMSANEEGNSSIGQIASELKRRKQGLRNGYIHGLFPLLREIVHHLLKSHFGCTHTSKRGTVIDIGA